jgi:hypothetical protein
LAMDQVDLILEQLEKRKKKTGFVQRFKFEAEGDSLAGEITAIVTDPFRADKKQIQVRSVRDGEVYSLPSNVSLMRAFEEAGAKKGDFVMAKFLGKTAEATKRGFYPKLYEAAVFSAEEARSMFGGNVSGISKAPAAPAETLAPVEKVPKKAPAAPAPAPSAPAPAPAPAAATTAGPKLTPEMAELKESVDNIIEFYTKIKPDDLLRLVKEVKGQDVPLAKIIMVGGLKRDGEYLVRA